MFLIIKHDSFYIAKRVTMWHYFKNYWHATKWSSISFSHWQCPSDGGFSFPRFVGLLILSLWCQSRRECKSKSRDLLRLVSIPYFLYFSNFANDFIVTLSKLPVDLKLNSYLHCQSKNITIRKSINKEINVSNLNNNSQ
jgi:hypothetical protein